MPLQSEIDAGMIEGGTLTPRQPKLFQTERGPTLLPAVDEQGKALPDEQILSDFKKTGQHLGVFASPEQADKYATRFPAVRAQPEGLLGAMFRQENEIVSALTRQSHWDNLPERGFNLVDELKSRGREDLFDKLAWVNNSKQLGLALSNLEQERRDREIIDLSPWWQALPAGVFAGMLSPTMLLPGGGVVQSVKGGYSIVKSAALIGAFAGAGVAVQEGMLHASQQERTLGESAVNVAGGVVLGGLVGAVAAKAMTRAERIVAERAQAELFRVLEEVRVPEERIPAMAAAEKAVVRERVLDTGLSGQEADELIQHLEARPAAARERDLNFVLHSDSPEDALKDLQTERELIAQSDRRTARPQENEPLVFGSGKTRVAGYDGPSNDLLTNRLEHLRRLVADGELDRRQLREAQLSIRTFEDFIERREASFKEHGLTEDRQALIRSIQPGDIVAADHEGKTVIGSVEGFNQRGTMGIRDAKTGLDTDVFPHEVHTVAGEQALGPKTAGPELHTAAKPGGADVARSLSREDYGIAGAKVSALGKVGRQFFPGLRMSYSPFTAVRKLFNELTGSNLHTNASRTGHATVPGGSAFDQMKVEYHRLYAAGLTEQFNIYKEMKKAGVNMSWAEFDKAVGNALRNGDSGSNDYITRGAVAWRARSIEPMAKLQQAVGALSLDGDVVGALSYFPRSHNRDVVIAHQDEFERRLLPHAQRALENAYADAQKKLTNRTARLEREIAMLSLDKEGRAQALSKIEDEIALLGSRYPAAMEVEDQIKAAGERLRDRSLAPDVRAAIKEDLAALRAQQKDSEYGAQRVELERQRKAVDLSFGGNEAKADKIIDKLEELNEQSLRNTQRLIAKGQQFEREKNKLSPERWEQKRQELRKLFELREAEYDKHVDKIEQELWNIDNEVQKAHDAIEVRDVETGSNFERIKAQQEEVAKLEAALAPVKKRLEKEKARAEKAKANMARVNERLAAAEDFDPEEAMRLFRVVTEELKEDMANAMTFRGMRAQRLIDRMERVSPDAIKAEIEKRQGRLTQLKERFDDKWTPDRTDKPPLGDWAKAMVRDYFDAVTGIKYDKVEDYSDFAWPTMVGPLKGRANWVPESALTAPVVGTRGFLNDEASHVLHHYLRVMAGDVALRRQYGNISLQPELAELGREFSNMQSAVGAAKSTEELRQIVGDTGIRFGKDLEKNRQRAYEFLDVQHRTGQEDVRALRDRILGRYKVAENQSNFGRFVRAANQINYMRLMGGVVLSSLTEIYRPAMVHGLGAFVNHIVDPMIHDIEALKLGVKEAKDLGLVTEMTMLNRMHDFAELADPMAHRTAIERLIDNGTAAATRWSGLAAWTDLGQAQAAIMTQARVLKAIAEGKDTEYLRFLNIGQSHAADIKKLFQQYGEIRSGVYVSNADRWTEGLADAELHRVEQARMALWSAIRKEVDSIIVMQSPGDTPLFTSTPAGKAILQFRSYNMSAHQKVMLRGLQEGPGRFVSGLATMTMMGMGVAALQAWRGGEERWKKFKESAANPGFLVGEGLDKSGIFPLMFDVGQAVDSVARTAGVSFDPVKTPMLWPFPQESQAGDQSRWALGQGAWGLAGPTANFVMRDIPRAGGAGLKWLHGEELSASEKKALQEPLPYKNYVGMNWILQALRGE